MPHTPGNKSLLRALIPVAAGLLCLTSGCKEEIRGEEQLEVNSITASTADENRLSEAKAQSMEMTFSGLRFETPPTEITSSTGRLLTSLDPHIQFFVTQQRHLQLTILDKKLDFTESPHQGIEVIAGSAVIILLQEGSSLISEDPLPDGDDYPLTVIYKRRSGELISDHLPPIQYWPASEANIEF